MPARLPTYLSAVGPMRHPTPFAVLAFFIHSSSLHHTFRARGAPPNSVQSRTCARCAPPCWSDCCIGASPRCVVDLQGLVLVLCLAPRAPGLCCLKFATRCLAQIVMVGQSFAAQSAVNIIPLL